METTVSIGKSLPDQEKVVARLGNRCLIWKKLLPDREIIAYLEPSKTIKLIFALNAAKPPLMNNLHIALDFHEIL